MSQTLTQPEEIDLTLRAEESPASASKQIANINGSSQNPRTGKPQPIDTAHSNSAYRDAYMKSHGLSP